MKYATVLLALLAVGIWCYDIGTLAPAVQADSKRIASDYMVQHCELLGDNTGAQWYECSK